MKRNGLRTWFILFRIATSLMSASDLSTECNTTRHKCDHTQASTVQLLTIVLYKRRHALCLAVSIVTQRRGLKLASTSTLARVPA